MFHHSRLGGFYLSQQPGTRFLVSLLPLCWWQAGKPANGSGLAASNPTFIGARR